jgi:hypothetical protein
LEAKSTHDLAIKVQNSDLEVHRLAQNLKFHQEQSEKLAHENLELKSANDILRTQMTQIVTKIQGHFKLDTGNKLITNDEWGLQQEIERLKEKLADVDREREKLLVMNFEMKKEVADPERFEMGDDLNGSNLD